MGVGGRVCENISRRHFGICLEGLGKTDRNLKQIIGDLAEIRNKQLWHKMQMRYGLKQLALLLATFCTVVLYCTIVFKDFRTFTTGPTHTREDLFTSNYKLICNRNAVTSINLEKRMHVSGVFHIQSLKSFAVA
jgi:hypothetical protein